MNTEKKLGKETPIKAGQIQTEEFVLVQLPPKFPDALSFPRVCCYRISDLSGDPHISASIISHQLPSRIIGGGS